MRKLCLPSYFLQKWRRLLTSLWQSWNGIWFPMDSSDPCQPPSLLPIPMPPRKSPSVFWVCSGFGWQLAHSLRRGDAGDLRGAICSNFSACPWGPRPSPHLAEMNIPSGRTSPPIVLLVCTRMPWLFPANPCLLTSGCDLPCYKVRGHADALGTGEFPRRL